MNKLNVKLPMCFLPWIDKSKINSWCCLSRNPCAIELLKENPNKLNWDYLSLNPCKEAIELLKQNRDKINWSGLSSNPCKEAIELLKLNPNKIDWSIVSSNPNIFTYDYDKMRENCLLFKEDLKKERFHPRNLYKFGSWGHNGGIDEEEEE